MDGWDTLGNWFGEFYFFDYVEVLLHPGYVCPKKGKLFKYVYANIKFITEFFSDNLLVLYEN